LADRSQPSRSRNDTIDSLRGLLIVLVFVGHSFDVPVIENPWKWLIYGFHMPIFMVLSGYLINVDTLRRLPLRDFFEKYAVRLLAPWLIAIVVYTAIFVDVNSPKDFFAAILYPYYHLWYVPVLFVYVVWVYINRFSPVLQFLSLASVSVLAMAIFGQGNWSGFEFSDFGTAVVRALGDKRLYTMAIFFGFGVFLRKYGAQFLANRSAVTLTVVASVAAVIYQALFYSVSPVILILTFIVLNLALSSVYPHMFSLRPIKVPILYLIGIDSLYFYLWHPLIFMTARKLIYPMVPIPVAMTGTTLAAIGILFAVRSATRRLHVLDAALGLQPRMPTPA